MIVDMFAGAGGWDVALRLLGLDDAVGYEYNPDACQTRRAAGFPTVEVDLATIAPPDVIDGLIASPPCQSFSKAGKRGGLDDARGQLVYLPLAWTETRRPRWCAWEQVPDVLPIWRDAARRLEAVGYRTWTGLLDAERYGVPQTRTRAILIASLDRPVGPPRPTHQKYEPGIAQGDAHACGLDSLFDEPVAPWLSMVDALGVEAGELIGFPRLDDLGTSPHPYRERDLRAADLPAVTVTVRIQYWRKYRPATTLPGDPRIGSPGHHSAKNRQFGDGAVRLTIAEAATLQTFPPEHPWHGGRTSQFLQIGNAIPPLLARAVLAEAIGIADHC